MRVWEAMLACTGKHANVVLLFFPNPLPELLTTVWSNKERDKEVKSVSFWLVGKRATCCTEKGKWASI
jgi:hypothetical protein